MAYLNGQQADQARAAPAVGRSAVHQVSLQVLGGLLIAAATGGVAVWGTSLVLTERLQHLSEQVSELGASVREMRRDLYRPRYERDKEAAAMPLLPAGRP